MTSARRAPIEHFDRLFFRLATISKKLEISLILLQVSIIAWQLSTSRPTTFRYIRLTILSSVTKLKGSLHYSTSLRIHKPSQPHGTEKGACDYDGPSLTTSSFQPSSPLCCPPRGMIDLILLYTSQSSLRVHHHHHVIGIIKIEIIGKGCTIIIIIKTAMSFIICESTICHVHPFKESSFWQYIYI